MTSNSNAEIAEAIQQMRTPLARVELAASRLAREAVTPNGRNLAAGISEAVSQIDRRIEDCTRALNVPTREPRSAAGGELLDAIRARLSPVLRAHAVRWERIPTPVEAPVVTDRNAAEQAALSLMETGITLAGAGGQVMLSFARPDEQQGEGLTLEVDPGPDPGSPNDEVLAGPRELALRLGGSFEIHRAGESIHAILRLGQAAQTPPA